MDHEEWLERAEIYALGALDGEELSQFEAHLVSGCALCEERLRETRDVLVQVPRSLPPVEPPQRIKTELLRRIAPEPGVQRSERPRFGWLGWGVGISAVAAAGTLLVVSWNLSTAHKELRELRAQIGALQIQAAQREELIQLLSDPQVRLVSLAGLPPSANARGQLLWNPLSRTGLLLATGLSETARDKAYELWGIAGAEAIPAGVFTVNAKGQVLFRLPALPESKVFDKFAVTIEPAAGVPKATGPMVLLGNL